MERNFLKDLLELNPDKERFLVAQFIIAGYSQRTFDKLKQGTATFNAKNMVALRFAAKKLKLTVPEYEVVNQ